MGQDREPMLLAGVGYLTGVRWASVLMGCEGRGAPGLVLTFTTTDMPGRSIPSSATSAGTTMRTGRRWTILVKFPVALSGGSKENTEPEAGARLATRPSMVRPGSASTEIDTGCPAVSFDTCVSLKFASI